MPTTTEALHRLLVALLVGLLIGLERERAEERKGRKLFAGVRTFPLVSLLAGGLTLLHGELGAAPLIIGFLGVALVSLVAYVHTARNGEIGATTEIAALVTYGLGVLAGAGLMVVAGAAGVVVAVLLAAKPRLEAFSRALSEVELSAALELAVISAIVLPLLPDKGFGPWGVLNPFKIWLFVVLVSAVSFAGFVAVRWKGEAAGLFWAAGLGALVSSTAVTVSMAQRSRENPQVGRSAAAAAVLASVVMCVRVLVLAAVAGPMLLPQLAPPVGAMTLVGAAACLWLRRHADMGDGRSTKQMTNPFSLKAALLFGALFAGVFLLVRASQEWLGSSGTYVAATLSGLVDVDAISIALARNARSLGTEQAVAGIVIACASNSVFKAGVAVSGGAGPFRRFVALSLGSMALVGGVVVVANRWLG